MKKNIIKDIVFMLLFWAMMMALDSSDTAYQVVNDFEDIVGDLMPWASYQVIEEVNTVIWIIMIAMFCSFCINYIWNFGKKLFNK